MIAKNVTIPSQSAPTLVMSVFGWIIFQQNVGGNNGNNTWADYKVGFGAIGGDFWLGLEKVHLLTNSQPYRLRVELQEGGTNLWYSAEYWTFKIGDELNDRYRLDVSGYSGDAGDSLQYEGDWNGDGAFGNYVHDGMKFTTYDRDNDDDPLYNCALKIGAGWWYNRCYWACLTCHQGDAVWWSLPQNIIDVGRMMIKPQ